MTPLSHSSYLAEFVKQQDAFKDLWGANKALYGQLQGIEPSLNLFGEPSNLSNFNDYLKSITPEKSAFEQFLDSVKPLENPLDTLRKNLDAAGINKK